MIDMNLHSQQFAEDYEKWARYIYEHPNEDKQSIKQYLLDEGRCIPKAFAMQYLIGAIEASDQEIFKKCMNKIRTIPWGQAMTNNVAKWNVTWDGLDL